jgi:hypothetical protein
VDGLKRKHKRKSKKIMSKTIKSKTMSNFQLNFNSPKKVVSITLDEEEGIFQLAYLFKKLLDDAGIPNKVEEKEVEVVEATEENSN